MFAAGARKKKYRVIQWGTGGVGTHALRAICDRADLELAGVRVYNPAKVGVDAGEICKGPNTGIKCVGSLEDVLAIQADCVNYNALSSTSADPLAVYDELCTLLEAGFNVTSSAPEGLIYPNMNPPELLARIEAACRKGNSSLFVSGVNPGYMFDVLPIALSRVARRIDRLYCAEVCSMIHMKSPAHFDMLGFGKPLDAPDILAQVINANLPTNGYATVVRLLADAFQVDIDDFTLRSERAASDKPIKTAVRVIEPGTTSVLKFCFIGWSKGKEIIELDFCWRMDPEVRPDWPTGDKYIVRIEGDPRMNVEIDAATDFDSKRPISLHVAMATVNAIPTICEASPGLKNVLDLPLWGGRMAASNR